ncbi:hypothetical protein M569_02005 [Genlisea aurea]|uniref:Enhancer of polycomb-like protein n=1 Tax=Genlisea aurea TaxID=192259 RepID=S8D0B1_9LAMI|nr:hypothetical protein M569_02005 [Genlisea aurea]
MLHAGQDLENGLSGTKIPKSRRCLIIQMIAVPQKIVMIQLNDVLVKLKDLRFKVHLTVLPLIRFLFGVGISRIAYDTFMLQHGIIVSSLAVLLEMLFIDNNLGLKLLVYEGSLGQALTFVSLTLALFTFKMQESNMSLDFTVSANCKDSECVDDPVSEVAGSVGIPDTASDHEASEFLTEAPAETVLVSNPSSLPGAVDSASSNSRKDSESTCMIGTPSIEKVSNSKQTGDAELKLQKGFVHEANPAGSIKSVKRGRTSSILTPLEYHSPLWLDDTTTSAPRAFSNGPKKPRTQVQYSLPVDGYDLSSKQKMPNSRALPYKRIRRASLKRISESHENGQKNLDLLTCVGNILVSHVDKGWREHGANVVLEVADRNEWRLAVKVSGVTKYSHKVKHILQPGSTNRYSHAMMWKGGKDWALEFPDRSQWMLFKEMHEECYNRNIRAASVKNIPIPGVRLVEESDVYGNDAPFSRNSPRYIRQVQTDVERAMDQSRMLYDMDTDDEQWLLENNNAADRQKYGEISEEYLEKAMDMFEKVSYAHPLRENFPASEIEELVMGLVSVEAGKAIYEHWRQKREKTGMPLIRHLQPPLWERYQQQLKEWEKTVSRAAAPFSDGTQLEKPPMFAFCLKPRGLEILNRERRWSGGHGYIDERLLHPSNANYSSDVLVLSPRDASLKTGWKGNPTFYKNKQKKLSAPSYPPPPPKQLMSGQDLLEYNARDASGAASHARRLAKLKKYRAHRLFCRADIAIQRAAAALMTAEAIKDSTTEKNAD